MKKININHLKQILYPLLVYYLLYNLSYSIFSMLFEETQGALFCLLLSGVITLVPEVFIYLRSPKLIREHKLNFYDYLVFIVLIFGVILWGLSLNYLFTQTGLIGISSKYSKTKIVLNDGNIYIKILCNCIVIPILEEILYRGIICGQTYLFTKSIILATVFSSFCFGFLHFNIVQFMYAFLVGLALGAIYCKTKSLIVVILAHGLTNLAVILYTLGG